MTPTGKQLALCQPDEIPDNHSRGFGANGLPAPEAAVLVVKHDGNIHVYRNRCPHLGTALEWLPDQFLDRDRQYIQCATHGALFRIDNGECVSGPCLGDRLQAIRYEIREKYIMINTDDIT